MNDPSQEALTLSAIICIAAVISLSSLVWIVMGRKVALGEPLVRYEGRCPVPWKLADVLAIFGLYFLPTLLALIIALTLASSGDESADVPKLSESPATGTGQSGNDDTHHSVIDLLRQDGTALTWILCAVAAVVVAPIVEEFIFRLVLQGWLEAVEQGDRKSGMRGLARGTRPILVSSILFASVHFRFAEPAADPDDLRMAIVFQIGWSVMVLGFAVAWLRSRGFDLTLADVGIDPGKVKSDIRLGLTALLAMVCPILVLQLVLTLFLPGFVVDPIPLFFFALVLGYLYYRTHRLLPAIVAHMALNATSLFLVWTQF